MKRSTSKTRDRKKPSIAAASHFQSTASMHAPPMFASMQQTQPQQDTTEMNVPESQEAQSDLQEQDQENIATIHPGQMLNATKTGHEFFKSTSHFTDVNIHGAIAFGNPGCLEAANAKSIIYAELANAADSPADHDMARAVSKVISDHLQIWCNSVVIPGLNWYPAFSFFPGPFALPMPNIPTPLQALPSFSEYLLTNESTIAQQIMSELPGDMDNAQNRDTVIAFSEMATSYFELWLDTSFVYNIMGSGNIPSFSALMPGGPVVGKVIPTPGALK